MPPSTSSFLFPRNDEQGIALVIVILIVALASILVTDLSFSTYMGARSLGVVERQLQAEYTLKSLVNFSAGLLKEDATSGVDAPQDPWGFFIDGREIPTALLGISDPGIRVFLEINPTNSKLRLSTLRHSSSNASSAERLRAEKSRDYFKRLFYILLNEPDLIEAEDHLKVFNRSFSIEDMISNLIDYMDEDSEPYSSDSGYNGIENESLKHIFKNDRILSKRELSRVPGFNPERLQKISPFVAIKGEAQININTASSAVIQALHEEFTPETADEIRAFIEQEGPLSKTDTLIGRIDGFTSEINNSLRSLLTTKSHNYVVIAKVGYESQGSYFLRARLIKEPGDLGRWPSVENLELY